MSYSITIVADTKEAAKQEITDKFDEIVRNQPSHFADRAAASACGRAFIDILADIHEGMEIHVSMYGSLSCKHNDSEEFTQVNFSITAALRAKQE